MDKYCSIRFVKTKTFDDMNNRYKHNHRLKTVANANPEKSKLNKVYIDTQGKDYKQIYTETIEKEYKSKRKIRKDAVKGIEIVATFSHGAEEQLDLDSWSKDTISFVADHFGGVKNIKDAVLHLDEATPHLHLFVIPMTDGRLCFKKFINGRSDLVKLQDVYGKAMAPHGLKRGEKGSFLKHEDIRKFYADLGETLRDDLPEPKRNESIQAYYNRANKVHKKTMLQKFKEMKEQLKKQNQKYCNQLTEYLTLDELLSFAKKRFGSVKKAIEKLEQKYYQDLGLEATRLMDPDYYQMAKGHLEILEKSGHICEERDGKDKEIEKMLKQQYQEDR